MSIRMKEMIASGEAIDISNYKKEGNEYIIETFIDNVDYCVLSTEEWVWVIVERKSDGKILASTKPSFEKKPGMNIIWLR